VKTRMVLVMGFFSGFAACKEADSVVMVNVSINPDVAPMYSLRVSMSTLQTHDTKVYPATVSTTALPSSTSFVILLPRSRTGVLDLALDGADVAGNNVAHGTALTTIVVGGTATTSVVLAAGPSLCGNDVIDPGETCDDGNEFSFDECDFRCQVEGARLDAGHLDAPTYDGGNMDSVVDAISERWITESAQDTSRSQDSKADGGTSEAPEPADATLDVNGSGTDLAEGGGDIGKPLLDAPRSTQADTGAEIGRDAQIDGAVAMDSAGIMDAHLLDATAGYTMDGVTLNLGANQCAAYADGRGEAAHGGGWDPSTGGIFGTCFKPSTSTATNGICGPSPVCGVYAPGTLLIWDAKDPRFQYLGDPTGGYICLPNGGPYVVPC
jgi:cysteine-rich repeat protein